jgi:sugar/nucleoside kinase (ribokinase family)
MTRVLVVGDLVVDVHVEPARSPVPGEEVTGAIGWRGGGSAANQAAWLAHLGADVVFSGRVGDDLPGDHLTVELSSQGVEVAVTRDPDHPTGAVAVLLQPDGDRSLVTARGANAHLQEDDVGEDSWRGAEALVLTGYTFTRPESAPAGQALLRRALLDEVPVLLDPASSLLLLEYPGRDRFLAWTEGATWLCPNLSEALALARTDSGATRTGPLAPEAAADLLRHYDGVVITTGADGCVLATRADREPVALRPDAPSPPVVDATGAGDAFAAGFLLAWLREGDPRAATRAGLEVAAEAVSTAGARPPRTSL